MIRAMTEADLIEVLTIEEQSFSLPWSRSAYEESLGKDYYRFTVEETDGKIRGYAAIYLAPQEAELLRIAVDSAERKKGIAQKLLDAILKYLKEAEAEKLFLEVRSSNEAALRLYQKTGFHSIGIRKGYYENPKEDAVLMELPL